jgi:hypothetical protein
MKVRNIVTIVASVIGGVFAVSRFGTGMIGLISGLNVAALIAVAGVGIGKFLDGREDESLGFAVKDERTQLIDGRASSVGFRVGNYVWLALIWYEFAAENFMPWPRIGSPGVMLFGLLVNLGIYFASIIYYRKRA